MVLFDIICSAGTCLVSPPMSTAGFSFTHYLTKSSSISSCPDVTKRGPHRGGTTDDVGDCQRQVGTVSIWAISGFTLSPLLKEGWRFDDFRSMWNPAYPQTLTKLRNSLVHARESWMTGVIAPTTANYERLRPWLGPLSLTAMQVMLFRDV